MAPSVADRRPRLVIRRWLAALCAAAAVSAGGHAPAAELDLGDSIYFEQFRKFVISKDGTTTVEDVQLRQGRGDRVTRVSAAHAVKVDKPDRVAELNVTGAVHVEFRDAVLDADSAFLVVRNDELVSVQVTGSQARFSHQPGGSARRVQGRADEVAYDAASGKVRFSGNTFWTDGRIQLTNEGVVYDINDGSVSGSRGSAVLDADDAPNRERERERVPGPRAPDRGSAQ